jgi:hypothetical protein
VPCIMQVDDREAREQRQQAGQIEQDARAQRLRDHSFIDVEIDQHAERDDDECRPYQSGEKRRTVHIVTLQVLPSQANEKVTAYSASTRVSAFALPLSALGSCAVR